MAVTTYTVIGGVIVHEDRGGVERDYIPDTLGSTVALADSSSFTDTWVYWPYGEVRSHTGTSTTSFTYVGTLGYCKVTTTSQMTYVRARMYLASRGRWATVDPLWSRQPAYTYVTGMPSRYADPDGLQHHEPKPTLYDGCIYFYCAGKFTKDVVETIIDVHHVIKEGTAKELADKLKELLKRQCKEGGKDPIADCVDEIYNGHSVEDIFVRLLCSSVKGGSTYTCACLFDGGGDDSPCNKCCDKQFGTDTTRWSRRVCGKSCDNYEEVRKTECIGRKRAL